MYNVQCRMYTLRKIGLLFVSPQQNKRNAIRNLFTLKNNNNYKKKTYSTNTSPTFIRAQRRNWSKFSIFGDIVEKTASLHGKQ